MNTVYEVANALGLKVRRTQQLAAQGDLPKPDKTGEYDLSACVRAYIKYKIDSELKLKQPSADEFCKEKEQARYAAAQADKFEFDLAVKKGEYLQSSLVEKQIETAISNCRAKLLAIPKKTAVQLVGITEPAQIERIIKDFVYEGLNELVIPNFDERRESENPENNL